MRGVGAGYGREALTHVMRTSSLTSAQDTASLLLKENIDLKSKQFVVCLQ